MNGDQPVIFFIDYETTGLDILNDHVVEVGVVSEAGACFSTVICPPVFVQGPAVHGIDHAELAQGPSFAIAQSRMTAFIQHIVDNAVEDSRPHLKENAQAVLCAHNGRAFDIPLMFCECLRNNLQPPASWCYVDTLEVTKALNLPCVKLQCLRRLVSDTSLRAHRALDDVFCLRAVVAAVAEAQGLRPWDLLKFFVFAPDLEVTFSRISVLTS